MKLPFGKKKKTEEKPLEEQKTEEQIKAEAAQLKLPRGPAGINPATLGGKRKKVSVVDGNPAQELAKGMLNVRDIIAPAAIEVDFNEVQIGNSFYRTIFVSGYPRFVGANWLSPVINFDHSLDISMFYYPVKSKTILDDLRKKITELEATLMTTKEKGQIADPAVTTALDDAKALQDQLVKGVEKYFQFSFYITIPAESKEELDLVASKLESTLGSLLLISKTASLQMEDAFKSTLPTGQDKLLIARNMDTTSLATTFPFTSSDLTMDEGIMYGINRHNGSLVIFDRFSMENANTVVFAKSGAGKSYFVKLEALRLMLFGAEVMIIDPEEEYRTLCEAIGGDYIDFSANSPNKINPFDLSGIAVEGENELGQKLISLLTLLKLMLGEISSTEEAILDRALMETYRIKGITTDPDTQMTKEPPVMEDLYKVLLGFAEPEARGMAERLEKFIRGSMTGIFDSQSTINLNSKMSVFSTKNLEETLRPIAFYIILDFVWTRIRRELRKRILIVEEAWYLMENEDSARFIYGIAKRARKYFLGLTTISQDVDDFLGSEYGKAIVTNSSIQMLFKQHPAAIDKVADTFYLSEGERRLLLAANVGEGLFFAGTNHVAINIKASEAEHNLITTNPQELLKLKSEGKIKDPAKEKPKPTFQQQKQSTPSQGKVVYKPYNPQNPNKYSADKKPITAPPSGGIQPSSGQSTLQGNEVKKPSQSETSAAIRASVEADLQKKREEVGGTKFSITAPANKYGDIPKIVKPAQQPSTQSSVKPNVPLATSPVAPKPQAMKPVTPLVKKPITAPPNQVTSSSISNSVNNDGPRIIKSKSRPGENPLDAGNEKSKNLKSHSGAISLNPDNQNNGGNGSRIVTKIKPTIPSQP